MFVSKWQLKLAAADSSSCNNAHVDGSGYLQNKQKAKKVNLKFETTRFEDGDGGGGGCYSKPAQ